MNRASVKSYLRALASVAIGAVAATFTSGWKAVLIAVVAACAPVVQRWLDPTDPLTPSKIEPD